jgi:hypothetical protein
MPLDLIIATNTVSEPPTPPASGTPGWPTDGTAAAGFADATVFPSYHYASILQELLNIITAAGETPSTTNNAQLLPAIQTLITEAGGVVGSVRNLVMSIPAVSATATLTADEISVETALAGLSYRLGSFDKTINLATTGAGGMDTGAAPDSGYVAIYAIYDPATATAALLATNATTAVAPSVYGGAHMPAGFTASALVSVWPTNSSGEFDVGYQVDRDIYITFTSVAAATTPIPAFTALSIASVVPPNAKRCFGEVSNSTTSATGSGSTVIASNAAGVGGVQITSSSASGFTNNIQASFGSIALITQQTVFWLTQAPTGTFVQAGVFINGYTF